MYYHQKDVFQIKTKDITVKVFNMIASKIEAKAMVKHISCDCKCKFNSTTCNSIQKWNNKTCQCERNSYRKGKKGYSWNCSACIYETWKYLKSIADISVIMCDKIISVMDIVSTKITNIVPTNGSIDDKKVRCKIDCYILHAALLAIILPLIITVTCYYYAKHKINQKSIDELTI